MEQCVAGKECGGEIGLTAEPQMSELRCVGMDGDEVGVAEVAPEDKVQTAEA